MGESRKSNLTGACIGFIKRYAIVLILVLIMLVILLFPIDLVEIFHIKITPEQINTLAGIAIGSLSSVFGIIGAIYILAFSLFEKNYSRLAYRKFMSNGIFIKYFQVVIMTIIIFMMVILTNSGKAYNYNLNLFCIGIILYLASLVTVYPVIKKLITESKSDKYVLELFEKMNQDTARRYMGPESIKELDCNPFFELVGLIKLFIDNNERTLILSIIEESQKKISEGVSKLSESSARDYIKAYLAIFRVLVSYSIKTDIKWIPRQILNYYYIIRADAVKSKRSKFVFYEYENFIDDTIFSLIEAKHVDTVRTHLQYLASFIELNIENYLPNEEDIGMFSIREGKYKDKKFDHQLQFQWDLISYEITYKMDRLGTKVIKGNLIDLYSTFVFNFNGLIDYVINSEKLSTKQKRSLLIQYNYSLSRYLRALLIDEGNHFTSLSTYDAFYFDKIAEFDEIVFVSYYTSYEEIILELFKLKQITPYILNDFATMGRTIAKHVSDNESVKKVTIKMVTLLKKLAVYHLKELRHENLLMYKELYDQATSIVNWVKKDASDSGHADVLADIIADLDDPQSINEGLDDIEAHYDIVIKDMG